MCECSLGGDCGINNQKSPTILLLTPELEFHSFGYAARDHYHDLEPEDARNWYYFDKFKMALHHNAVSRQPSAGPFYERDGWYTRK